MNVRGALWTESVRHTRTKAESICDMMGKGHVKMLKDDWGVMETTVRVVKTISNRFV